jgi:Flp pilus assembly protein TadG
MRPTSRLRFPGVLRHRAAQSERGQTLVLVALAVVALCALVALGIDLVRLYDARSEAQNAADHAATTSAHALCRSHSPRSTATEAMADGMSIAAANGFGNNGTTNTVAVVHNGGEMFTATATRTIQTAFAGIVGWQTLDASATAVADCTPRGTGTPPGPIFAGGEDCPGGSKAAVDVSGNGHIVNGVSHSNHDWYNGGTYSEFNYKTPPFDSTPPPNPPGATYVGTATLGPTNTYTGSAQQVAVVAWPAGWAPSDMSSMDWSAYDALKRNPDTTVDKLDITANGVWYVDRAGGVVVESISTSVSQFVVVNRSGPVMLPNDLTGRTLSAYNHPSLPMQNIIVMSGFSHSQPCDQFAIEKSGQGGTLRGILWAPGAVVRWSGNYAALNGAVISHAFQMNGNDHRINFDGSQFSTDAEVVLLK